MLRNGYVGSDDDVVEVVQLRVGPDPRIVADRKLPWPLDGTRCLISTPVPISAPNQRSIAHRNRFGHHTWVKISVDTATQSACVGTRGPCRTGYCVSLPTTGSIAHPTRTLPAATERFWPNVSENAASPLESRVKSIASVCGHGQRGGGTP